MAGKKAAAGERSAVMATRTAVAADAMAVGLTMVLPVCVRVVVWWVWECVRC